jgi:plasmid stabilization system protein ParE
MSHELIIRPEAEEDILNARRWYERQRPGLGGAFILSIEAAIGEIRRRPESFPIVRKQARRMLIRRFPYAIYFVVGKTQISVLAVVHGARHPKRWRGRI